MNLKPDIMSTLNNSDPLAKSMTSAMLFNEKSGGKVYDANRRRAGIFASGAAWAPGGVAFESDFDCVEVPDPEEFIFSEGTIFFKYRHIADPGAFSYFFVMSDAYGTFSVIQTLNTNEVEFHINGTIAIFNAEIAEGTQTKRAALVWNDATNERSLYVNGIKYTDSTAFTFPSLSGVANFNIGGRHDSNERNCGGVIEYFHVLDKALSEDAIRKFMQDEFAPWDTEPVTVFISLSEGGTVYNVSVTDGISLGESVAAGTVFNESVSDGIAAGESIDPAVQMAASVLDGVVLGDTAAAAAVFNVAVTDSIVTGDAASASSIFAAAVSDGLVLGEALAAVTEYFASVADGVALGELAAPVIEYQATVSDGVKVGDSATVSATFNVEAIDGVQFGEILSAVISFGVSVSDGITFSDSALIPSDASGIVTVSFSVRRATITFNIRRPEITAAARKPTITGGS